MSFFFFFLIYIYFASRNYLTTVNSPQKLSEIEKLGVQQATQFSSPTSFLLIPFLISLVFPFFYNYPLIILRVLSFFFLFACASFSFLYLCDLARQLKVLAQITEKQKSINWKSRFLKIMFGISSLVRIDKKKSC